MSIEMINMPEKVFGFSIHPKTNGMSTFLPGEHTGLWEGEYVDGKMVMKQSRTGPNGENLLSQLTFYNITDEGFDWKGEVINLDTEHITVNWKIKAKKIL